MPLAPAPRLHGLPVQLEPILIHKGQTKGEAFRRINPLGKVWDRS